MRGKWIGCLMLAGLVLGLSFNLVFAEEAKADKGKIIAKVNDVPLYEKDVYLGMPQDSEVAPQMKYNKEAMLQEAIKQELLYQEAKKEKLEEDPSYKELLNQREKQTQEFEVESLAQFFESVDEGLQKVRAEQKVSDEEIAAYYKEHQEQFGKMTQEQASNNIRRMLENMKHSEAYGSYMKKMLAKTEIKINGKPLPAEVLTASVENSFRPPVVASEQSQEVLFPKVSELAAGKETKSDADVKKAFQDAVVTIGKSSFRLGDCYQLTMILNRPANISADKLKFNRDPMLFMVLKNHILAEEAKKAGLDKDSRWAEQKERMGFLPGQSRGPMAMPGQDQERAVLTNFLVQKLGLYDFEKIQVSQEEIDQYYEKNQARYKRLTPDRAKENIKRRLRYEKSSQKMNEYVDGLRKAAKIEILEPVKKEEAQPPASE